MKNIEAILSEIKSEKDVEEVLSKNTKLKSDKDFYIKLSRKKLIDENTLSMFDENVRGDKEVIEEVFKCWPHQDAFKHTIEKLKDDENIAFEAISAKNENIQYISDRLKEDRVFMLKVVSSIYINNQVLRYLPTKYQSDKEFLMLLLKKDYQSFSLVSEELKNDVDLLWSAMFDSRIWYSPVSCYKVAGQRIKADKDFFKKITTKIKEYNSAKELLETIKEEHKLALAASKGDKEGALAEIKSTLKNFKKDFPVADSWTSYQLSNQFEEYIKKLTGFSKDKKIMEMLVEADLSQKEYYVKNVGFSINVLHDELKKDIKFLSKLMEKTGGKVFKFLPEEIKNSKEFIISNYSENIKKEDLNNDLINDGSFIIDLAMSCANSRLFLMSKIKYIIGDRLLEDKIFVEKFVEFDGSVLDNVSNEIRRNKKIIKKAIDNYKNALIYADKSLFEDVELLKYSVSKDGDDFIKKLSLEQLGDKKLLLSLLSASSKNNNSLARNIMRDVPYDLKKDKELALACVSKSGWSIESVDENLKYDKDILTAAFKTGCHIYKNLDIEKLKTLYADNELRNMSGNLYQYLN